MEDDIAAVTRSLLSAISDSTRSCEFKDLRRLSARLRQSRLRTATDWPASAWSGPVIKIYHFDFKGIYFQACDLHCAASVIGGPGIRLPAPLKRALEFVSSVGTLRGVSWLRSIRAFCGPLLVSLIFAGCGGGGDSAGAPTGSTTSTAAETSSPPATTGTATVSWVAPTNNSDGSSLTSLAGYTIHYGASASSLTQTIQIANAAAVSYVVTSLSPGTWYFAVSTYTNTGVQSGLSTIASKTI